MKITHTWNQVPGRPVRAGQGLARRGLSLLALVAGLMIPMTWGTREPVRAQAGGPVMLHPNLGVRTVVEGLELPTTMAFLGPNDLLVLEKNSGLVKRVTGGVVQGVVLDLAVNFGSERGLLGIALHPRFPANPGVYLYWTESSTGIDTDVLSETPLLGNRVDRYRWDGTRLTHERNLIRIRAIQQDGAPEPPGQGDADQPERGNHDGGVLAFGPDRKLYVFIGDLGRRGWLQNLFRGPTPPTPDDQFGGPQPDDAHLSGCVLRLGDDGSAPRDNPFFFLGRLIGGEVGENLQRLFSYGHRNSFGMAFDPRAGHLWLQENGDDTFSEVNRVEAGMNGGWVQIMGPAARVAQFKEIETSPAFFGLQQLRWPPTNLADTPLRALLRLFWLPGSRYSDPEFSWKFEIAPAGLGFAGRALGSEFEGDMFLGASRTNLANGYLLRLNLTGNRRHIAVDHPGLADRVDDNLDKHTLNESASFLIGRDFGVGTDVETGPNGNLFVVSLSNGAIYEVFRRP